MTTLTLWQPYKAALPTLCMILLAGCGGGGGGASPTESPAATGPVASVVVAGDSLADVGAFGAKATIQNSADPAAGFPLFPELVAQALGVAAPCNFYRFNDTTQAFASHAGCRNFAVGSSRIVNPAERGGATVPLAIPAQLAQAVVAAGGHWRGDDLLLIDGGANDLSDLATAFLVGGRGGTPSFRAFLLQQLDAAVVDPLLAQGAAGASEAGRLYMLALADTLYGAIQTQALAHGARRVAVLNLPDITLTPRFQAALAIVAANISPARADAAQATIREWVAAYNGELQGLIGADARVVLVDFNAAFTSLLTYPAQYGITNTTTASCPGVGVDELGLTNYALAACMSAALDAAPPAGSAPGWWHSWIFADDFHLTPYGHELLASAIRQALVEAGWQ